MDRLVRYFKDREWAATVGVLTTLVAALPTLLELVSGELEKAGNEWSWRILLPLLAALIIRFNVWSKATVVRLTGDETPAEGPP